MGYINSWDNTNYFDKMAFSFDKVRSNQYFNQWFNAVLKASSTSITSAGVPIATTYTTSAGVPIATTYTRPADIIIPTYTGV